MRAPLAFLDTETCGLEVTDPIWEIALVLRRGIDLKDQEHHFFVQHDPAAAAALPEAFQDDHQRRYDPHNAWVPADLASVLEGLLRPADDGTPIHIVGALPSFDVERIIHQLGLGDLPHRLVDVRMLAVGFLAGSSGKVLPPPWGSDWLSTEVGIDPERYERHTALGDARWTRDLFDQIIGTHNVVAA